MTTVKILGLKENVFGLKVEGHCAHDVCVSVSALTNAILQYADTFSAMHEGVKTKSEVYESGNVLLEMTFGSSEERKNFVQGLTAIEYGYLLYQDNFPKDVAVHYVNAL